MYSEKEDSLQHLSFGTWKKIFSLVFKKKKDAVIIIIYMVILAGLDIFTPFLSAKAIDLFFGDNPQYDLMWPFIGCYCLIAILYFLIIFLFIKRAGKVEAEVSKEISRPRF